MTIASTTTAVSYNGNSVTTVFPVPFYFLLDTDLVLTLTAAGPVVIAMGLNVDYTVAGHGDLDGGVVTMTVAVPTGSVLKISRVVPVTQLTDYITDDPFPAESHEKALDKLTMICQQLQTNIDNAVLAASAGGEANTASNLGGGLGVFKQKSVFDLQFRSLSSPANGTVGMAIVSDRIEIDVKYLLAHANIWNDIQSFWGPGGVGVADPGGEAPTAARVTRYAGPGAGPQDINTAFSVHTLTDFSSADFEWNQLNRLDNYSATGENVSFYAQAWKNAAGATWAGVFEAHDSTHTQPSAPLYGLEIDISANGSDISGLGFAQRFGVQLVGYRDDPPTVWVTASITTNVMTVTVASGVIVNGMIVAGLGVEPDTTITSLGTGTGGTGTYNLSATPNVASRLMGLGGGLTNYIGNGIVLQSSDGDPYGSRFTNSINLASNGDIGLAIPGNHIVPIFHSGSSTYGMKWDGTYATVVWEVFTASDVPLMSLDNSTGLSYLMTIGSANNFLSAAAVGTYAGGIKIKVDGNDRFIPFYSHP